MIVYRVAWINAQVDTEFVQSIEESMEKYHGKQNLKGYDAQMIDDEEGAKLSVAWFENESDAYCFKNWLTDYPKKFRKVQIEEICLSPPSAAPGE